MREDLSNDQNGNEIDERSSSTEAAQEIQSIGDVLFEQAMWLSSKPDPKPLHPHSFVTIRRRAKEIVLRLASAQTLEPGDDPGDAKLLLDQFKLSEQDRQEIAKEIHDLFLDGLDAARKCVYLADEYVQYSDSLVDDFGLRRLFVEDQLADAGLAPWPKSLEAVAMDDD
jgi:hypothetical protein